MKTLAILLALGSIAYAADYPVDPSSHANFEQTRVDQVKCRKVDDHVFVWWDQAGGFHKEDRTKDICTYRCGKGHEWETDAPKTSVGYLTLGASSFTDTSNGINIR